MVRRSFDSGESFSPQEVSDYMYAEPTYGSPATPTGKFIAHDSGGNIDGVRGPGKVTPPNVPETPTLPGLDDVADDEYYLSVMGLVLPLVPDGAVSVQQEGTPPDEQVAAVDRIETDHAGNSYSYHSEPSAFGSLLSVVSGENYISGEIYTDTDGHKTLDCRDLGLAKAPEEPGNQHELLRRFIGEAVSGGAGSLEAEIGSAQELKGLCQALGDGYSPRGADTEITTAFQCRALSSGEDLTYNQTIAKLDADREKSPSGATDLFRIRVDLNSPVIRKRLVAYITRPAE